MPGKLLDTTVSTNALGLLASVYTDSEDEDENGDVVIDANTKGTLETHQNVQNSNGNGNGTSSSVIIAINSNGEEFGDENGHMDIDANTKETSGTHQNGQKNNDNGNSSAIIVINSNGEELRPHIEPSSEAIPEGSVPEVSVEHSEEVTGELHESVQEGNELIRDQQRLNKENSAATEDEDIEIISIIDYNAQPFTSVQNTEKGPKSDSETSDSELDSDTDYGSDDSDDIIKGGKIRQPLRVKGELLLSDLPPIEDLHISVPHEQCEAIGTIKSVVDSLVVVESYTNSAALNLDTVLFMEEGDQTLGHIFDVFGPVTQPHYCVRFNSKEHMSTRGVEIGKLVYCAPKTEYTSYVLMGQLRLLRGTDASWQDDIEPPPEEIDFSDDEAERVVKKGGRKNPVKSDNAGISSPSPSFPGRGRGRKRCANYGNGEMKQQAGGVYNHNSVVPGSPFIPPFVSGFYPPSMRFRSFGPRQFIPGYGPGFYTPGAYPPRPYYMPRFQPQPQYHPYFNSGTANNSPYGPSFNNYGPPHSSRPGQGQTTANTTNGNGASFNNYNPPPPPPYPGQCQTVNNTPNGNGASFNNYEPPPPPPHLGQGQAVNNTSSNRNGSLFNNYDPPPPPPPPRVEGPRIPHRQYY